MSRLTPFEIRPALASDIPEINAIYSHYIANTVLLFALDVRTDQDTLARFHSIKSSGLPYLVAVNSDATSSASRVLGFCLVAPFRGQLAGYRHTVELSLYCHPEAQSRGVGSALLDQLSQILRDPLRFGSDWISEAWTGDGRVQSVIACMALDSLGPKDGWGLKDWYEQRGFEMCGRLRKVGRKFDRWIDTVYMQLTL